MIVFSAGFLLLPFPKERVAGPAQSTDTQATPRQPIALHVQDGRAAHPPLPRILKYGVLLAESHCYRVCAQDHARGHNQSDRYEFSSLINGRPSIY